jgi:hypothetical protein
MVQGDGLVVQPVVISRMDGGPRLIIEQPERLAWDFFSQDASSVGPLSYDAHAGRGESNRITFDDIRSINRTMRARSKHSAWAELTSVEMPLPWLEVIDVEWDLVAMGTSEWESLGLEALLAQAINATMGSYRNLSVTMKILHLKRPKVFPVLDSLVIQQLGASWKPAREILRHLREQGYNNLAVLREIQTLLDERKCHRPLVRILDVLLWATHPSAGLAPGLNSWVHIVRPNDSSDIAATVG